MPKLPQENVWKLKIEEAPLNDDLFKAEVVCIDCAGSEEDRNYLSKFELFAINERRFVIKNICKSETIFMINQLGVADKKVKDDNLRVFEEGQRFLKEEGAIPADILALIIKQQILKKKEEYFFIKRHKLEVQEGLRRESLTMIDREEVKGIVSSKPEVPVIEKPTKGKGKGDVEPLVAEPVEGKKYNTVLRERGEEWRDRVYVDDFPIDGPNIYIALTGFSDPYLPLCLVKIGVPISAVIQIRIDVSSVKVPPSLLRITKRNITQADTMTESALKYWQDLQNLRVSVEHEEGFKNTAFVMYKPPYWESDELSGAPDKIYDEISYLMYDIQDLARQHANFLNNMSIFKIPADNVDERYFTRYGPFVNDIPLESCTIYTLLDNMVHIACLNITQEISVSSMEKSTTHKVKKDKSKFTSTPSRTDVNTSKAKNLIRDVFNVLCQNDQKTYRVTYGEEFESHKDPIVIKYGDIVKYNTFHLHHCHFDKIIEQFLSNMPLQRLWLLRPTLPQENEAKNSFHVNMLLSCFEREDVETAELTRLMHILACRKVYNNRSSLKKQHISATSLKAFKKMFLKRSIFAEPFPRYSFQSSHCTTSPSFPSITNSENLSSLQNLPEEQNASQESVDVRWLFDCPDISELASAAEIASNHPISHVIDDFEFFEDFDGICAAQVLLDAFNKFNCVDYKYCEVTDSIILMFFNSHDQDGISREEWRCSLPTPLCLQDFFDFVLEEQHDWITSEEKKYDESIIHRKQSLSQEQNDHNVTISCVDDLEVDIELLMEGSLKHKDFVEMEESEHLDSVNTKSLNQKPDSSFKSTPSESKGSRNQSIRKSSRFIPIESVSSEERPFFGYDLCDRRIEVFGKDSAYFSRDRTHISTFYTLLIPENAENIVLSIVPGDSTNEFWLHRSLGECTSPEILKRCNGFRINTKDNLMINISKKCYEVPKSSTSLFESKQHISNETPINNKKENRPSEKTINPSESEIEPPPKELVYFYGFCITWPNGLIIEGVYENGSSKLSHIKQFFSSPQPYVEEDCRCITMDGEILIFKTSGDIELIRPDGSRITITDYDKRIIEPDILPIVPDKSKGKKEKKGKEKKEPSPPPVPEKPPEYELIIDQYEVIEANGLKQQWIKEVPFDIEKLIIRTATDYITGETFCRRQDGTNTILNKDGIQIVTFPDKSRIITTCVVEDDEIFPEWTEEELLLLRELEAVENAGQVKTSKHSFSQKSNIDSIGTTSTFHDTEVEEAEEEVESEGYVSIYLIYTVENCYFPRITISKNNDKVTINSPNNTSLTVDVDNNYDFDLDGKGETSASFDGENLHISYEACPECKSYTTCDVKIEEKPPLESNIGISPQELADDHVKMWVKLKDSFCKKIVIDEEGNIHVQEEPCSPEEVSEQVAGEQLLEDNIAQDESKVDWKSKSSFTSHGKCREMYQAKNMKFIVMHRDLTCSELVHRTLLDDYKQNCRWQPWCSMNQYDTFGDHRLLHTVLTPVRITEAEKWIVESFLADKPKNLTFKDLKKVEKGWYHWMRPYERFESGASKPEPILMHKLPRAFILRTLEQQWRENEREKLKGAKELLKAVLRYRNLVESESQTMLHVPIVDFRSPEDARSFSLLQEVARSIYEDLKNRLEDDVNLRCRALLDITTAKLDETASMEGEGGGDEREILDLEKYLYRERQEVVTKVEEATNDSPMKKYWRIRVEALKEEEFYLYLLREGSVPIYFLNILGGALWWEINNLREEATTIGQRRKMKCVCHEEATTSTTNPDNFEPFI